ncbi:cytochrome c biogenesis protein CcsA [Paraflavitalea sp. CAU 1676]|uniref:cytochrome c biogenesis protein CcsA n=1 Tax=Paraflavitalea sp. CAU 1676 TaxID=3032598 RepID=UPI0023DAAFFC|nr:cytochrome c biogenesis protein CcsA [Paraflavitalea sp. CAU 1676]MDF2189740.1 cytochrome c biogenesis protein CcsA [Paraflavitalea sp. CAU 1676]
MRQYWWKILCIVLLLYTFTAGFLVKVPEIGNLYQTIRNLFFHVPMWFAQLVLITISLVYSIMYLRNPQAKYDLYALQFVQTGTVLGCLGLVTGMIWANYTWGTPWNNDPKQLGVAIALLIYLAYFVLRNSMTDLDKRGRVAAVYNIFAYFIYIPMILILPRLVESLHPGGKGVEGNPGLNGGDLDPTMRLVFWPAVLGWTLLGVWITTLYLRMKALEEKKHAH